MQLRLVIFVLLIMALGACDRNVRPGPGTVAPGGDSIASALASPEESTIGPAVDSIVLDGDDVRVRWADGDSLTLESGARSQEGARLAEFNTLESYQAVQRWGDWSYEALADVNATATALARSRAWACTSTSEGGGYGRTLIECPGLRDELITRGLAHLFTIRTPLDVDTIGLQRTAQESRRGIWANGVPDGIVTSVSSTADGHDRTFDRVVNTQTGQADRTFHEVAYTTCHEVCHSGSCMRYLPFDRRFGPNAVRCEATP